MNYVKHVITVELNSVTDNPIVFPEEGEIISGGNFHGQPLALALDFLAIAAAELANISERRIERLVNPQLSELPPFLVKQCGLNSGYMIAQYTAASLVSENKVLAHPASVDSIPSSANQEDHVSMGAISARKAGEIIENVRQVLAIELMCAAQAIDLQAERTLGKGTQAAYNAIREIVPPLMTDRVIYTDINKMAELVGDPAFTAGVYRAAGLSDSVASANL
jgi:histidine ammonia-lyase